MNRKIIVGSFAVLLIAVALVAAFYPRKEKFTQGYNYLISGCIQKCELERLHRDPYFVQLQEGGYMTKSYCEQLCATEYNKNKMYETPQFPSGGACMLRRPSYHKCPLKRCRYFGCPNKRFDLIGNDVKTVNPDAIYKDSLTTCNICGR